MKNNKKVLSESFFKRDTYSDRIQKNMPQYTPAAPANTPASFGKGSANDGGIFAVTDVDTMKKRLAQSFGAAFGTNSIKSMAGKAIKTFPIIVSDNVEPETVIALKKLMEEQYADYISLMVSNKVIDLSAYSPDQDGETIAIQALDDISGTDFSKNRVADKASRTGSVTPDDVMMNFPLYSLIRENYGKKIETGNELADILFENALVIPDDKIKDVQKFIRENAEDLIKYTPNNCIDEAYPSKMQDDQHYVGDGDDEEVPSRNNKGRKNNQRNLNDYIKEIGNQQNSNFYDNASDNILASDEAKDHLRGLLGVTADNKEIYNKLTNAEIVVDTNQLNTALNRSVGEFLCDPRNGAIKDRFEKATFLLQAGMVTGGEYVDYVTMRLGIPMSRDARAKVVASYRNAKNIGGALDPKNGPMFSNKDLATINKNEKLFYDKCMPKIMGGKVGSTVVAGLGLAGVGTGAALVAALSNPVGWAIIGGSAIGAGAYFLAKWAKKRSASKVSNMKRVEGWERVEALINRMDAQRAEVADNYAGRSQYDYFGKQAAGVQRDVSSLKSAGSSEVRYLKDVTLVNANDEGHPLTKDELDAALGNIGKHIDKYSKALAESINPYIMYDSNIINESAEAASAAYDECLQDPDFEGQMLYESVLCEKKPLPTTMTMKTYNINKQPGKDVLIAPAYSARSDYAYGSTEIDPKLVKDRKYNQPLLMTIKFKERYSDGKFSDNELTAVIGILGKVIRVPSNEMKYILAANSEGQTIRGAFGSGDIKNAVADLLSKTKINKNVDDKLPQSADVWRNLEKVATLAVANKMAGKKSSNIANAHIVFSEKEIDEVRTENGIDYKRDMKLTAELMKRYSAFTLMIADDPAQRLYIYDGNDDISWNPVPYSAIIGKDTGDQLTAALARLGSGRI